jgi:hypothetical protein
MDASFGDENTAGGLGAILTQIDQEGHFYIIAYASRKLQKYEQNYTPFFVRDASCDFWHGDIRSAFEGTAFQTVYRS